jgi:hypothetical protein
MKKNVGRVLIVWCNITLVTLLAYKNDSTAVTRKMSLNLMTFVISNVGNN